ncbi:Sua5/YciO/YrdC/YwlC family protein [Rhodanobacter sp. L36]|uniref:L-threonylcarbamoyladenylate synthase n=1 Tax=Rhodanobacter sp. L36 TaxID=1747221 RepID=UPI00131ACF97|nr:Sua5/YciO/YrdC/YwlC family protein [Rhodanobacter sp. L36]
MLRRFTSDELDDAADVLHNGGVIAYPTEAVFGLGCDPHNHSAFVRLFALKQRPPTQGVLLIAAEFADIERYIETGSIPTHILDEIKAGWPGPRTWIFSRSPQVPAWVAGDHPGIALRVTAHEPAAALCRAFGGAIVSTSANLHGHPAARSVQDVVDAFGDNLDGVLDATLGGQQQPTVIRDALSGAIIRA